MNSADNPLITVCTLPNGCTLYRKMNQVGGWTYLSDEVGGGVHVWDTALVDGETLLAAILDFRSIQIGERLAAAKKKVGAK